MVLIGIFINPYNNNHSTVQLKTKDPAHKHQSRVDMLSEIASEVSFTRADASGAAKRQDICRSRDKRFIAYTTSEGTERLFVHDTRTRTVYEIKGIPLAYRPLSDLHWKERYRLEFDRWSQPHYGVHYELDVLRKKLVAAYGFPD
jgi:hypothetical protein